MEIKQKKGPTITGIAGNFAKMWGRRLNTIAHDPAKAIAYGAYFAFGSIPGMNDETAEAAVKALIDRNFDRGVQLTDTEKTLFTKVAVQETYIKAFQNELKRNPQLRNNVTQYLSDYHPEKPMPANILRTYTPRERGTLFKERTLPHYNSTINTHIANKVDWLRHAQAKMARTNKPRFKTA
ncbi:hypothetical protein HUU53_04095 [Candidatus Micrarchaeota archaeon]|nr:hypothetical protein [Candidatus Micrarchaeota archaeon]